jgi:alpha-glucosidase (family GH31 glycosyl hydrolase)
MHDFFCSNNIMAYKINQYLDRIALSLLVIATSAVTMQAQQIKAGGQPAQLDIRIAGEGSIRITLKPLSFKDDFVITPALVTRKYPPPFISVRHINSPVKKTAGNFVVEVKTNPLTIAVHNKQGKPIQKLIIDEDGKMSFQLKGGPVLGMGEGGPKPAAGVKWRELAVEYDRRGRYHKMQPRWQADAYGSRNPVAMLIEPGAWAIFIATPWVEVDLQKKDSGFFVPWKPIGNETIPQTARNQGLNQGKGIPPIDKIVPGLYDFFVFDAHNPAQLMKDFSVITGPAAMPPKWTMGYMQSHRTLEDDKQMLGIIDSFRSKRIPVDAVIYLGTGFTPRGWNKPQPSFEFNPEVFKRNPKDVVSDIRARNVKLVLHMVPWDRDKLPTLQGNIPAGPGEIIDASHIENYWKQHVDLVNTGVDAFWPDEGDWFNLHERIKRYQLYYQGHLSIHPGIRPWSLQRNGYPGIAQWGGWVWSGDTESSWKTLETQIAVGLNYSMSIGPYWGTDIGGFYPNPELTGELYARWFQFGAFCGSFRSHGRTWQTRLPWGWGQDTMGPVEGRAFPLQSEMKNKAIEPIAKKYDELRYQLMPYNYTLAWEARNAGMPMMRAMWLHYPSDEQCKKSGDQYLWGRDLLIAPVYEKGATSRTIYLPGGDWYDWWSHVKESGSKTITREVDVSTLPIYVRAGAIIPIDPVRQYSAEAVNEPTTLKIFRGANGQFTLYDDDGISQEYLKRKGSWTAISWNEQKKELTIAPGAPGGFNNEINERVFNVQLVPGGDIKKVIYKGALVRVKF